MELHTGAEKQKLHWEALHKHPCIDCGKPCGHYYLRCVSCGVKNKWRLKLPEGVETKSAKELGLKGKSRLRLCPCVDCGKERWISFTKEGNPTSVRCVSCSIKNMWRLGQVPRPKLGEKSPAWKGGRWKIPQGYIMLTIQADDFFYQMAKKYKEGQGGHILEHRLVMAKQLKRCLLPWEVVHHKNGIKDDNRIENLQLLPDKRFHLVDMNAKKQLQKLETKVDEQAKQIRLLKWQIKQLQEQVNVGIGDPF